MSNLRVRDLMAPDVHVVNPDDPIARLRQEDAGSSALEIVLDGNRISQLQRELMERPENYLRPIRVREYWRPPGVEDNEVPEGLEPALAAPR